MNTMTKELDVKKLAATLALSLLMATAAAIPANAATDGNLIKTSQLVDAAPQSVYKAVQQIRSMPGHQLESYDGHNAVIKEIWTGLPIIGDAVCVYRETEVSPAQIDYKLVSSDKIVRFEGSWTFQPADGGKKTLVTLSTSTQANVNLPFAQMLTDRNAAKRSSARIQLAAKQAAVLEARNNQ